MANRVLLSPPTNPPNNYLRQARGLPPVKEGGRPDPFCVVSVCGRRQKTVIQRGTANCLWDLTFTFPNLSLSQRDFRRESIYVQVRIGNCNISVLRAAKQNDAR